MFVYDARNNEYQKEKKERKKKSSSSYDAVDWSAGDFLLLCTFDFSEGFFER